MIEEMFFKPKLNQRGFTLLEVMVAGTILVLSLMVIINLFSKSLQSNTDIRNYTLALILAQSKMAEIKSGLETDIEGKFEDSYVEYKWSSNTQETPFEGIEEIHLQVSWKGKKKEKRIDLMAYRLIEPKEENEDEWE